MSENRSIRKAAVIGAGTMGRAIAAHLANAGIPSLLLDIVPPELGPKDVAAGLTLQDSKVRNRFAAGGLAQARKDKPAAFYSPRFAEMVEIGNTEDDLGRVAECDWVVEVVLERLDIKQQLFTKLAAVRSPGTLISSNTSGIRIADMLEAPGLDDDFKQNFLVTHFFNPVRYMRLLEVVPAEETNPAVLARFQDFAARRLGKGLVVAKDTPNFIANRIGVFGMMATVRAMADEGLDVTTMDAILGTPMARPKSGAFRLADMVGLDVLLHVARNVHEGCPGDDERGLFVPPDYLTEMVKRGWTGAKGGQGFYKKLKGAAGSTILQLNLQTMEYEERPKVRLESTGKARKIDDPGERIKALIGFDDVGGRLGWRLLADSLCYSAKRIPEIADDIVGIDRALRWGFAWDLGPFESWDAIGLDASLERMAAEGREVPELAAKAASAGGFYKLEDGRSTCFDLASGSRKLVESGPGHITVLERKQAGAIVKKGLSATMVDLGDGALCLEFHSKMNAVDDEIMDLMHESLDVAERDFDALVIANDSNTFSAGANVMLIYMAASQQRWDEIDKLGQRFQNANQRMRYGPVPTVSAPTGMTLGGGCEVALGTDSIRAHAELYLGLVEVGMGIIPAGGGCKELLRRLLAGMPEGAEVDPFPFVRKAFENIGMGKVSTSADDARAMGYLGAADRITLSRGRLLHDAKHDALAMAATGYRPARPAQLRLPGRGAYGALLVGLSEWAKTGVITEHEQTIGSKLARVLTGGDVPAGQSVSEQHVLDLEREAFGSLCGEPKTLERMQHFLMKGKLLRN
jgi:3-hydroxyacyl-CoA dehydrogenase